MGFSRQVTGVGCHSLLQGIFPTQGSNLGVLHCRQILYQLSHQGSPRILEQVAISFYFHPIMLYRKPRCRDFPGGPAVKTPASNAGDVGSISGWGTNIPSALWQLSPCTMTREKPSRWNERSHVPQQRFWHSQINKYFFKKKVKMQKKKKDANQNMHTWGKLTECQKKLSVPSWHLIILH